MRWFHWTVDQFMCVYNPPNAEPLVLERMPTDEEARQGGPAAWIHTKASAGGEGWRRGVGDASQARCFHRRAVLKLLPGAAAPQALYRLAEPSRELLKGCAPDMCQVQCEGPGGEGGACMCAAATAAHRAGRRHGAAAPG